MNLAPQEISLDVLREKYCKGEESTVDDVRRRVARALAAVENSPASWEPIFYDAQKRGVVMAGRINSAAGTDLSATLINCFVQPVGDSISGPDATGYPGIFIALREAAETMRRGGGVGYDFSRIRPKGAVVSSTQSEASGPVSYMRIFDSSCETVQSAGARRGAQMGILRVDHPDVDEFIRAKYEARALSNFNLSLAVPDSFMKALEADEQFELVHAVAPSNRLAQERNIERRADGLYVYQRVRARELWDRVMRSTYDHGEPGVVFIDRIHEDNNLHYCERIDATNPCAEEPLPPYGCCCLASINLAALITEPFTERAAFSHQEYRRLIPVAVRMLDNVLDATSWPLPEQHREAMAKRRIGLGVLGLGDALIMLGVRYDSEEGRKLAGQWVRMLRDCAYTASTELAAERRPFPRFEANAYLASGFVNRLPENVRGLIAAHGIRNSHLLAIAPTGTITLAFADNASNGIEPAFAPSTHRRRRQLDGGTTQQIVLDHAYRVYQSLMGAAAGLPPAFISAREMTALDHARMVTAVQPFIDSGISKTVNIPREYPFEQFKDLYTIAWREGAKSLATFRENPITGVILSTAETAAATSRLLPSDLDQSEKDHRIVLDAVPTPTLNSLRWPRRPELPNGNPSYTYTVRHPNGSKYALFIGHVENGERLPFEVWVGGLEAPRGLNALAINLSYDMYARDRAWLKRKLDVLACCSSPGEAFDLPMPPKGEARRVPSLVAAMAVLLEHRCRELGAFDDLGQTPILDALMSAREPKTGTDGTMSWTVDVVNEPMGEAFTLGLKELVLPQGDRFERRPYAMWLKGRYPQALDGLCEALSLDMRIIDPAWIAKKLRELLNYAEPRGEFLAPVPGEKRQTCYPSTVAYIARLVIHRFSRLGLLDERGLPIEPMGVLEAPPQRELRLVHSVGAMEAMPGVLCRSCGDYAVVRSDGCERCTSCGEIGACG